MAGMMSSARPLLGTLTVSGSPWCPPTQNQTSLWRPWLPSSKDGRSGPSCPHSRTPAPACVRTDGKAPSFQHPVRLFWPKSKSFDYLYNDGEALLRNFPVQATISFYEESGDDSEEDWEEDGDSEEPHKC